MYVYLDNNSTTPMHEDVLVSVTGSFPLFTNPSSQYSSGTHVRKLIDNARLHCAELINADTDDIVFTSGGTEANNTVLNYSFLMQLISREKKRNEVIVSSIEHHSVLNCAKALERHGVKVLYAPANSKGNVDTEIFMALVSERTALVSIMMANNEIGTIQDIKRLSGIARSYGALFHTDAVQAVGKIDVDVQDTGVDFLSYAGHNFTVRKGLVCCTLKRVHHFGHFFQVANRSLAEGRVPKMFLELLVSGKRPS